MKLFHLAEEYRCKLFGHKRGVLVQAANNIKMYRCPRCGAEWKRKLYGKLKVYQTLDEFGYDEHGIHRRMQLPPSVSAENEEKFRLDEINRVKDMRKE